MFDVIQDGIFWIFLTLDSFVYTFIDWIYRIILVLAEVDFFENSAILDRFIQRIYVILGVVMLFLVAYNLLRNIVNPDEAIKGKNSASKVVINVIISVVLVGVVPMIFTFAQQFQTAILQQGTLSAIILGTDGVVSDENTIEYGGFTMAKGVFQAFFHPTIDYCQDGQTAADGCEEALLQTGVSYTEVWDSMQKSHSFSLLSSFNDDVHGDNQVIDYTFLISTVAGVFVIFVLLSYCIDVAIRTVKLAFYQIIAPITILARIIPGEQGNKVFNNWIKASISTYLEIFIRLAILFFAVLVITILNERKTDIFNTFGSGVGVPLALVAFCFLILGIVYFMKQAPAIIKDLTGLDGGKYNVFGSAFKSMAMLGGGVTAAVRNWNDTGNLKGKNGFTRTMDRLRRTAAGAGSGMFRSTMNRDNVKDFRGMRANARDSANRAFQAHQERIAYSKSHPGVFGSLGGHMKDTKDKIQYWAHGNVDDKRLQSIVDLAGKVGKGANDSVESLLAMIHGGAKEQKRQLDAMKNKTVEVTDYFDSIVTKDKNGHDVVMYVEKGSDLHDPNVRARAIDASTARQVAQEANAKLYKDAKSKFEDTYSRAIASLYTADLNNPNSDISVAREAWGIKSDVSDVDARRQLEGFRNQITNRLNTLALDQTIAKETDASFNNLKSLNVEDIVEQLAQAEADALDKQHINYNIADLRKKYSTDTNAIAKQIMSNISTNKAVAGEIQREVEYQAAEAKVRNSKLNNDKKKD